MVLPPAHSGVTISGLRPAERTRGGAFEPWCVEVSTVSTVSTECRGGVEGVSVDTSVDGVEGVNGVSKAILTSGML